MIVIKVHLPWHGETMYGTEWVLDPLLQVRFLVPRLSLMVQQSQPLGSLFTTILGIATKMHGKSRVQMDPKDPFTLRDSVTGHC